VGGDGDGDGRKGSDEMDVNRGMECVRLRSGWTGFARFQWQRLFSQLDQYEKRKKERKKKFFGGVPIGQIGHNGPHYVFFGSPTRRHSLALEQI
jgi:hypothetical protein